MHELVYPIMQGYDSVAMDVDLEVGGTDQTFNMLVGRHLMKTLKNKEKFVLTVPLLIGADGQKMGKSTGNFIPIDDKPADMFGKIMSIRDDLLQQYFELGTDVDPKSVDLSKPMAAKKKLAYEIVKIYHGEKKAQEAQENFENTFTKGGVPDNVLEIKAKDGIKLIDVLLSEKIVSSKTEFRRLISEGAITDMEKNEKIKEPESKISKTVYKIGKHRFVRIK